MARPFRVLASVLHMHEFFIIIHRIPDSVVTWQGDLIDALVASRQFFELALDGPLGCPSHMICENLKGLLRCSFMVPSNQGKEALMSLLLELDAVFPRALKGSSQRTLSLPVA